MGIIRGGNIVNNGLVFGMDTGYPLVSTTSDAYRFNKGKPTTNLLSNPGASSLDVRSDIYNNVTKTNLGNGKFRFANDGTGATTIRLYCNVSDLTDGATYGCSVSYENFQPGVGSNVTLDWCDQNNTSFSGTSGRAQMSASRSTYNNTYRFLDISIPISSSIDLFDAQVELNSCTPFVSSSRSISGSLIDIKKTHSIKVETSHDSNAEITFDGTNDGIEVTHSSALSTDAGITLEYVVNADSSQSNLYPRLSDKSLYLVHLSQTSPFSLAFNVMAGGSLRQTAIGSSLTHSETTHLAFTYNGTLGKIYKNGSLIKTSDFGSSEGMDANTSIYYMGRNAGTTRFYNGKIYLHRLYNRDLTAEEILQNFNSLRNRFDL